MFFVVDTLSNNVLAECGTLENAESLRDELAALHPFADEHFEVIDVVWMGGDTPPDHLTDGNVTCYTPGHG